MSDLEWEKATHAALLERHTVLTLRVAELEEAIRYWAEMEPECNCGELAPGPCCAACRADRALRALVSPLSPSGEPK